MTALARPTPVPVAVKALTRCAVRTTVLVTQRQLRQPTEHRGRELVFADGTSGAVYRETRLHRPPPTDPAVLVVGFRLRLVRSSWAHAAFRSESLLNTVLFVGFPGFVSKLWLRHDERGRYRGFYQWDGPELAERYVGALRHVLALVSEPESIDHRVLPGLVRDDVLASPGERIPTTGVDESDSWWRLVDVTPPLR